MFVINNVKNVIYMQLNAFSALIFGVVVNIEKWASYIKDDIDFDYRLVVRKLTI